MFKEGDMVVCVDDSNCVYIKKGKCYKVFKVNEGFYNDLDVIDDLGDVSYYESQRFKKLETLLDIELFKE